MVAGRSETETEPDPEKAGGVVLVDFAVFTAG